MPDMEVKNSAFAFEKTIENSGDVTGILSTENTFVDKNIAIKITTPAVGAMDLAITDNNDDVTVGTASEGKYPLTATIAGTVTPATAGWAPASAANVSDTGVVVGKIAQSTMNDGTNTVASGSTINPDYDTQTINITAGYNGARTIIIGKAEDGPAGEVSSPNATATLGNPTYQDSGDNEGKFTIGASGIIAAPTVVTEGFIGDTVGTKNAGAISGIKVLDKITIGVSASASGTVTPAISKDAISISGVTDAAAGAAVTTAPSSGVYVKVKSAASSATVTSTGTVESAGYGTPTIYDTDTSTDTTVTINASADTYIPVTEASGTSTVAIGTVTSEHMAVGVESNDHTFPVTSDLTTIPTTFTVGSDGWFHSDSADGSASSVTIGSLDKATFSTSGASTTVATAGYIPANTTVGTVDNGTLSTVSTDPGNDYTANTTAVLVEGGYLTLTAGYYPATKISTATLVPDGTDVKGHAEYILAGHTALDEDGTTVTGSIPTYAGAYTMS